MSAMIQVSAEQGRPTRDGPRHDDGDVDGAVQEIVFEDHEARQLLIDVLLLWWRVHLDLRLSSATVRGGRVIGDVSATPKKISLSSRPEIAWKIALTCESTLSVQCPGDG